jgi:triphosphoribosyl-dephospho-CoA synthetase
MINLHVFNYLCEHSSTRGAKTVTRESSEEFKKLSLSHFQEHLKFISEYLRKCLKDMAKTRVALSPLVFRPLRQRLQVDEDFLRFENHNYGVKFVFTELLKECLMNLEVYRRVGGTRVAGTAMRKL